MNKQAKKKRGRPKGSPNKKTLALKERLLEMGAHPELVLAEFMLDEGKPDAVRIEAAKALMPYVHSKMPTELTGKGGGPVTFTLDLSGANASPTE